MIELKRMSLMEISRADISSKGYWESLGAIFRPEPKREADLRASYRSINRSLKSTRQQEIIQRHRGGHK